MALSVPLSRFTSRVGGGSAFFVRPLSTMSRTAYFGIGIALSFVSFCCGWVAFVVIGSPVESPNGNMVGLIAFCAVPLLLAAYGAFRCFARALRPPPRELRSQESAPPAQTQKLASGATADERLAPLLRKEKHDQVV